MIEFGTGDRSTRQVSPSPIPIPTHLPKFYIYAQKGPTEPQLTSGADRNIKYGDVTFQTNSAYANHQTLFSNVINAEGNSGMYQRVIPTDAGPESNFTLYLEVVTEPALPIYQRTAEGDYTLDGSGNPIPLDINDDPVVIVGGNPVVAPKTFPGYVFRWVKETYSTISALNDGTTGFGLAAQKAGTLTGTDASASTMYPILQVKTSSKGEYGNNKALRLYPAKRDEVSSSILDTGKVFPYFIEVSERPSSTASSVNVKNKFGASKTTFSLNENAINPSTLAEIGFDTVFPATYENTTDTALPLSYSDFDDIKVYYDNIKTVSTLVHASENAYKIDDGQGNPGNVWIDFGTGLEDIYLVNLLNGRSFDNKPYQTMFLDKTTAGGQTLNNLIDVYLESGSDGTMSNTLFGALVRTEMARYQDPDDIVQDTAINVESTFYDTGFDLTTKLTLPKFISQRKDTFLVLSTHDVDDVVKTASSENSTAITLHNALALFPDSTYFGTKVFRSIIVGQSGKLRNSNYRKRVPLSIEIAQKAAAYMGAGNGNWKDGFLFDSAPGNILTNVTDVQVNFIPATTKYVLWASNLIWAQAYDRRSFFFPALQTAYDNETSVLNGYFVANAIVEINKISWKAWREYTGNQSLTKGQLAQRIEEFITDRVSGKFNGLFVIKPEAFLTKDDSLRGYSMTLNVKIYSPNLFTVLTAYTTAFRLEDLNP